MTGTLVVEDRFVIGTGDVIVEQEDEGVDTLLAFAEEGLTGVLDMAGSHVENVTLTGSGSAGVQGTAAANALAGNAGDNSLDGREGNDILTGGEGDDRFVFSTAPDAANADTITDFTTGEDQLAFDDALFALALGALDAGAFVSGDGQTAAADADDRFIYDTASGGLYYDADGTAAGDAVKIATLGGAPALSASDFDIF
jgi:Ca2+-binding RTX toxin-like protein